RGPRRAQGGAGRARRGLRAGAPAGRQVRARLRAGPTVRAGGRGHGGGDRLIPYSGGRARAVAGVRAGGVGAEARAREDTMKRETIMSLAVLLGLTVQRVTLSGQSPLLPEHGQGQVDEQGAIGVLNAAGR